MLFPSFKKGLLCWPFSIGNANFFFPNFLRRTFRVGSVKIHFEASSKTHSDSVKSEHFWKIQTLMETTNDWNVVKTDQVGNYSTFNKFPSNYNIIWFDRKIWSLSNSFRIQIFQRFSAKSQHHVIWQKILSDLNFQKSCQNSKSNFPT